MNTTRVPVNDMVVANAVRKILELARLGKRQSVWIHLPDTDEVLQINARVRTLEEAERLIVKENEE